MAQDLLKVPSETDLWDEEHWPVLLALIEERSIIPIVGPDLLQIEVDGKKLLLDRFLAGRLASKYGLPVDEGLTLNDVVCALLLRGKQREVLSSAIHRILTEARLEPPRPLEQLAEITHFNLFVTTNFDLLLEDAIRKVRNQEARTIAYSPNENNDVTAQDLLRPTVYHLLGKSSVLPKYAISEEDVLEFVHALQSESRRPHLLFDELKNKNLLILGEHFPDWLARFFLRTAKQGRLSESRAVTEILADTLLHSDASLVLFLQRFSRNTRIFRDGGPIEFIDELWRRWHKQNPAAPAPAAQRNPHHMPDEMPPGAVFISYAHEDLAAVQKLRDALVAESVEVWFDASALQSGDHFYYKIKSYIEEHCSCFLMVLSANTEKKREGYFRREWDVAIERDKGMAHNSGFILPVAIDGTDPKDFKTLRPELKKYTITPLVGGQVPPEFIARVKRVAARLQPVEHTR
jgi:hypothetical protein